MKFFYYDHYDFDLPSNHRFPKEKYRLLRQRLIEREIFSPSSMISAPAATRAQLRLGHAPTYLDQIETGTLPRKLERELGLPLTPGLAKRVAHTVGATIEAAHAALEDGIASTGGGGTHHAQWDRPQGYCIYNDAIIAARVLQQARLASDILVIDCDVHQGNGTALIAQDDPSIFTFSIHCRQNFPARKAVSDLDVYIEAGTSDRPYLAALNAGLNKISDRFAPDLIIYLAGADPHENDRLGKLNLSFEGLKARDELVFDYAHSKKLPLVLTLAGGYGKNILDTVEIYANTLEIGQQGKLNRKQESF